MPLVSGATAAGFCIVRQLEYAEFGELYAAEHPRLPRLQLLQLIPADISADLDYREDFNQESDLAATLWHPNILGLTDRGEFEDRLWLSTDYLEGSDAAQVLGADHPDGMPLAMLIEIVSAIAEALDYAHDHGVLHRYVNPGNILISKAPADKRRIALSGFGVARPVSDKTNTLTRPGVIIGTASYTAPERLMDDAVDARADQYGLAASAFHLLTGSPPFAHFNPAVVISKQLNERPPRPSDFRPDLTEFDAIFARALSQDPVDRFRRCRDFARALELNGGKRAHVRATTDSNGAAPTDNGVAPTEPAPLAAPATESARTIAAPTAPPEPPVDVVTTAAAALTDDDGGDFDDDDRYDEESDAARRRRKKQTAAIAGTILVVVLAWFIGVRALRSASQSDDTPTGVETTSAEPAVTTPLPVAPPAPPAPVMTPPVVSTPSPVTTSKATPRVSTTPPTTATAPKTTRATTTSPKPATSATTTPSGLDTRPALGMPCGPDQNGAAAVSNSGGPVNCVSTPGGFAWEPPGVQPPQG
ncbi:MAG: serine/threonine-protein kinase [Mycobacterium sp.]